MFRIILLCSLNLLFLLNPAKSQYINTDSLFVLEGICSPLLIKEFDSLKTISPGILPGYYVPETISPGNILSRFTLPGNGKVISRFGIRSGRIHTGTDIKMNKGDTVYAVFFGKVTIAKYYYGYGNLVILDHGKTLETYYSHLSSFLVKPGENIKIGEPIGLAGSSGRATTNHLHFEIRENGEPYDAEWVFDFENSRVRGDVEYMDNLGKLNQELRTNEYPANEQITQKYIVRSGDSLWKISRRAKTTIQTLCELNNLTENSVLQVGQELIVY